jgi:hypothetical protein
MAPAAALPAELTHGPFTLAEARQAGLTPRQLQGKTWRRVGTRQNRLLNAGYRLLRFTAADLRGTPEAIVAQVRAALSIG